MTALDTLLRAPCHPATAPCRPTDEAIARLPERDHVHHTPDASRPHPGQQPRRQTPGTETRPTDGSAAVLPMATISAAFASNPFTKVTDATNQPRLRQQVYHQHRSVRRRPPASILRLQFIQRGDLRSMDDAKRSPSRAASVKLIHEYTARIVLNQLHRLVELST
jgi:hypothetical protein